MKKKRNLKAIISAISILLIIGISGILAYLTDADKATNTFTVGEVKIELQEPNWDPNNAQEIVSNGTLPKDPQVKNTGKNNAYIYLKVTVPTEELIAADETGVLLNNGLVQETQLFTYEINENWTELEKTENVNEETGKIESYTYVYYYNTELEPEATTETIFDEVKFANVIEGQVDLQEKQIDVQAYAIQSNNLPEGTTIETAYEIYVNQNGEGEVVEQQRLADVVEVGDYVNYDANLGLTEPITYTTDSTLTGHTTTTTYKSNTSMKWKVLSVDREAGTVELIAASNLSDLYLKGQTGYMNAEDILNDIGDVYGHGKGATGGRSVNIEDIEKYSNFDPTTYKNSNSSNGTVGGTKTYTSGTFIKGEGITGGTDDENDSRLVIASSSNPVTVTQTYYKYSSPSQYFENQNAYNTLLSGRSYFWLASRCVCLDSSFCSFYVHYAYSSYVGAFNLFNSSSIRYNNYRGVVPVVSLESNILTSGKDSSGVWQLKVE